MPEERSPARIGESLQRVAENALPVALPKNTAIAANTNASEFGEPNPSIANGEISITSNVRAIPIPPPRSESLKNCPALFSFCLRAACLVCFIYITFLSVNIYEKFASVIPRKISLGKKP